MAVYLIGAAIVGGFLAHKDQRLQSALFGAALGMAVIYGASPSVCG